MEDRTPAASATTSSASQVPASAVQQQSPSYDKDKNGKSSTSIIKTVVAVGNENAATDTSAVGGIAPPSEAGEEAATIPLEPSLKKQKLSSGKEEQGQVQAQEEEEEEGTEGPTFRTATSTTIYPHNTLQGQPLEVLANVSTFLSRADINAYGETCKRIHNLVTDPAFVELPWPLKCPFEVGPSSTFDILPQLFFSHDQSKVAVYREGYYSHFRDNPRTVEIWDKRFGLLGKVKTNPFINFKPVFSPNTELLLIEPSYFSHSAGIRMCRVVQPTMVSKAKVAVSFCGLQGAVVDAVTFIDNYRIRFIEKRKCGIFEYCINQRQLYDGPVEIPLSHGSHQYGVASNSQTGKDYFVNVSNNGILGIGGESQFRIHDCRRGVTVYKHIPRNIYSIRDCVFSRDGNLLVIASWGSLTVFDCSAAGVERIGEGKSIVPRSTGRQNNTVSFYGQITWLPGRGEKIAISHTSEHATRGSRLHIIDIEKGELLGSGWKESTWRMMVS